MGGVIYFIGVIITLMILIKWLRSSEELKRKDTVDVFLISLIILTLSFFSWLATFAIFLTWVLKRK